MTAGGKKKKSNGSIKHADLKHKKQMQIVNAVSELFSQKGYHNTTMRDISAASGIELSYLYKYISSKNDVLYLFYKHLHSQWEKGFRELLQTGKGDTVGQLKEFVRGFLYVTNEFNDQVRTMYTESRHLEREWLRKILSFEGRNTKSLEKFLKRGVEEGVFEIEDTYMTANILQYLLVIRTLRGWNFKERYGFDRFVELMVSYVLRSLGVPTESST